MPDHACDYCGATYPSQHAADACCGEWDRGTD
jgi:hypothetical protein